MANIEDVAKLAGVSKGTVSNVFTQKRPVRKEVVERVLRVASELHFKPNYWARTLSMKETRIIGLSMQAEQTKFSQFHLSLINGVLQVCFDHGYRLLVNTLAADYQVALRYSTTNPVDGEIFLDPKQEDERLMRRTEADPPAVVVGRPADGMDTKLCYVDNDSKAVAEQATQYLIDLGHKDILFLNTPRERTVAEDRRLGYERALHKAGWNVRPELHVYEQLGGNSLAYGYETTKILLAGRRSFSAVLAGTDKIALGVYRAAVERGVSIPDDISVFVFENESVFSEEFNPPLSGISLHAEDIGREAALLLLERLKSPAAAVLNTIIPSEIVVRESCRAWPGATKKL